MNKSETCGKQNLKSGQRETGRIRFLETAVWVLPRPQHHGHDVRYSTVIQSYDAQEIKHMTFIKPTKPKNLLNY